MLYARALYLNSSKDVVSLGRNELKIFNVVIPHINGNDGSRSIELVINALADDIMRTGRNVKNLEASPPRPRTKHLRFSARRSRSII